MKSYKFNPIKDLDLEIPKSERKAALEAAAELIKTEMLDYIGEGNSPVAGHGKFKGYTQKYKQEKGGSSSASAVNLELSGEMLDKFDVKISGNNLEINVFGDEELQGRAEGNNLGTYGQADPIPGKARRFIPIKDKDEKLKKPILAKLRALLKDYES